MHVLVEQVGDVLEANEDLVLTLGESMNLKLAIESWNLGRHCFRSCLDGTLRYEELDRLVLKALHSALDRIALGRIEVLKAEAGVNLDAFSRSICLVKRLSHSTTNIVTEKSSVNHDLNLALIDYRSALRAIVHNGYLAAGLALHRDSRLNRIIVTSSGLYGVEVEVGSVVVDAFLHLKAIAVCIERLGVTLETIKLPSCNDFFAIVINGNAVELDLPFKSFWQVGQEAQNEGVHLPCLIITIVTGEALDIEMGRLVSLHLHKLAV